MNLAQRVKRRRKEVGLSQEQLAAQAGVAQQSVNKIETGVTKKPRHIIQLARALDCDPEWLMTGNMRAPASNMANSTPTLKSKIPILSLTQAGEVQHLCFAEHEEWFETLMVVKEGAFVMKVSGNSMLNPHGFPSIPDGSLVIIEPCSQWKHGNVVAVTLNSKSEVMIKKLEIDGPHKFLVPLNPKYDPIPVNGSYRLVGTVKRVIMDLY